MDLGFKCLKCHSTIFQFKDEAVKCLSCENIIANNKNVFDFLQDPSNDVINEIKGMAIENGYAEEQFLDFKIKKATDYKKLDDKLESTKNDYNQYYQQTLINFNQAFQFISNKYDFNNANVLEIGAC